MKLDRYRKYVRAGVTAFLVLAASMIFYYLPFHQTSVRTAFHNVLNILSPLIAALILAYVISPIINFIEQRIIARLFARHGKTQSVRCKKLVRALLILLTYVSMLFALYGLIATLIPELFSSITNIVSNFSNYANNIQDFATKVLANYPEMQQTADQYISTFSAKLSNWLTNDLMPMLRTFLLNLSGQLVNMVTFFKNILLGAIVAIYMLYNKESYIAKLKKAVYALLGLDHGNAVIRDCQYVNQEFSGFLVGKVIDSIIIGAICYLVTSLIGTPYALLVSVIIGVTNIIPFFGPFLGAVPVCAIICTVCRNYANRRLEKHHLPDDDAFYFHMDHIDPETRQAIPYQKKKIDEAEVFHFPGYRLRKALTKLTTEESPVDAPYTPAKPSTKEKNSDSSDSDQK